MRYRIEYTGGRCKTIDGSRALIRTLKQTDKPVSDVRKVFQSGASDSVMNIYRKYLGGRRGQSAGEDDNDSGMAALQND